MFSVCFFSVLKWFEISLCVCDLKIVEIITNIEHFQGMNQPQISVHLVIVQVMVVIDHENYEVMEDLNVSGLTILQKEQE